MGRLFDTAAALLGFTRGVTFEGQAAMWLAKLARAGKNEDAYGFPLAGEQLDFRPLLEGIIRDRVRGRAIQEMARAFQRGIARGLCGALETLAAKMKIDTAVLSGGVFQNELLLEDIKVFLAGGPLAVWTNHAVPPNDGGISLG